MRSPQILAMQFLRRLLSHYLRYRRNWLRAKYTFEEE